MRQRTLSGEVESGCRGDQGQRQVYKKLKSIMKNLRFSTSIHVSIQHLLLRYSRQSAAEVSEHWVDTRPDEGAELGDDAARGGLDEHHRELDDLQARGGAGGSTNPSAEATAMSVGAGAAARRRSTPRAPSGGTHCKAGTFAGRRRTAAAGRMP